MGSIGTKFSAVTQQRDKPVGEESPDDHSPASESDSDPNVLRRPPASSHCEFMGVTNHIVCYGGPRPAADSENQLVAEGSPDTLGCVERALTIEKSPWVDLGRATLVTSALLSPAIQRTPSPRTEHFALSIFRRRHFTSSVR